MGDIVSARRPLGRTGIEVGPLSFGSAPLASVFWGNDEATAEATARRAVDVGIGLFDTAPLYGLGESEVRLGRALAGEREVAVATKVGRTLTAAGAEFDFSAEAVRRQLASSLERLGRDRVDLVHVHDPDDLLGKALNACMPALAGLKAEGTVGAISVGTTRCTTALHFLCHADVDAVMLAGRLTLLDQSAADEVVPACARLGVPLLAAAVFNSGVLARPHDGSWYEYAPADDETMSRVRALQRRCEAAGVSLQAAALAYPLRFDSVATVVVGMASPQEVDENVALLEAGVPDDLWSELGIST